jgi:hypothetical protein
MGIKKSVGLMNKRQFNKFWEIQCPKCKETIDLEILVNSFKNKSVSKK